MATGDGYPIEGIALWRIAPVGPVEPVPARLDLQIDGFGKVIQEN